MHMILSGITIKKHYDERNKIINNYIIIIGVPVSVIGVVIERIKNKINLYTNWIALFLAIVLILGFIIYDAYIVESFVSEKYLDKINAITEYLQQNFDKKFKKVFSVVYSLDILFLNEKESQKHRLRKGFVIAIINTVIIIGINIFLLFNQVKSFCIVLSIIFSFFIHYGIFSCHKKKEI